MADGCYSDIIFKHVFTMFFLFCCIFLFVCFCFVISVIITIFMF